MAKSRFYDEDDMYDDEDRQSRKKSIRDQRRQAQKQRNSIFDEPMERSLDDE